MAKQTAFVKSRNSGQTAYIQKFIQKLTVSEFADLKGCSRQTVYANKDQLTFVPVPGAKVKKILMDYKALAFKPNKNKVNKRFLRS